MKNNLKKIIEKSISCIISLFLVFSFTQPIRVQAAGSIDDSPIIVVSLGDSYSSGEGVEPFYGQEKTLQEKVKDEDWMAHRSQKSWASLLQIPGIDGTLGEYEAKNSSDICQWYFKAASGATTDDFYSSQNKTAYKEGYISSWTGGKSVLGSIDLAPQLQIFDTIPNNSVDYVTLTIGGNDVGFTDIITTAATKSRYGNLEELEDKLSKCWGKFNYNWTDENGNEQQAIKTKIENTYRSIANKAGAQANIIVAGYPKLLSENYPRGISHRLGVLFNEVEAITINNNVHVFNERIKDIVTKCSGEGMNIYFVSVEEEFDGHEAYSLNNSYINCVKILSSEQDLDQVTLVSAYSIHPNSDGVQAYANCVNRKLKELANKTVEIEGSVVEDSLADLYYPINLSDATVELYYGRALMNTGTTDVYGRFKFKVQPADYWIKIYKDGYQPYSGNVSVSDESYSYSGYYDCYCLKSLTSEDYQDYYTTNLFKSSEWIIGNKAVDESLFDDILAAYSLNKINGNDSWYQGYEDVDPNNLTEITSGNVGERYFYFSLDMDKDKIQDTVKLLDPQLRNIQYGDDITVALNKLGFSEYGINSIMEEYRTVREKLYWDQNVTFKMIDNWRFEVTYNKGIFVYYYRDINDPLQCNISLHFGSNGFDNVSYKRKIG